MTETFPLLRLPHLAIRKVIQSMRSVEVLDLSFSFKRIKGILMAHKLQCTELSFNFEYDPKLTMAIVPNHFSGSVGIEIYFENVSWNKLYWCLPRTKFHPGPIRNINETPIEINRTGHNFVMSNPQSSYQEKIKEIEQMGKHLLDIFHCAKIKVFNDFLREFQIFTSEIWKMIPKFGYIGIRFTPKSNDTLTDTELKFLMNEVHVDRMRITAMVEKPKRLLGIRMKTPILRIGNCDWRTMRNIVESESQQLDVTFMTKVQGKSIKSLVEKWRNGEKLKNLEKLRVESANEIQFAVLDELDGAMILTEKQRDKLKTRESDAKVMKHARRIQKSTDGKWAIIGIEDSEFGMFVLEHDYVF